MPSPLDMLTGLSSNAQNPNGLVAARLRKEKALLDMKRSLELQAGDPRHTFSGATNADVEDDTDTLAADTNFGTDAQARVKGVEDLNNAMVDYNRPDVTAQRKEDYAQKLALASAPAEAAAKGSLAVEKEKNAGALADRAAQNAATMALLNRGANDTPGGGAVREPRMKLAGIGASGEPSFKADEMPALVQRAHGQLSEAYDQSATALREMERLMPGINDAAGKADSTDTGILGFLGIGNGKYGGNSDAAKMQEEYLKYKAGKPTPWSNLFAAASFGNISQMAGQLPGVRGLATVSPLFKEHQSKFGSLETPVAMAQRLRHMMSIMHPSLQRMEDPNFDPSTELTFGEGK